MHAGRLAWVFLGSLPRALHAMLLGITIAASTATAQQDCVDYSGYMHHLGNVETPHLAGDVVVQGNVAYVACHSSGLALYDLSDPDSPVLFSSVDTPGSARGVAVSGNHAYVADLDGGFHVIDVSNALAPAIVGSVPGMGLRRVVVAGNHAYVVGGGFRVVDVSNPAAPQVVGTLAAPAVLRDVAISGTTAFCAAYSAGLLVVDVSNPTSPAVLGSVDTPDFAFEVAVQGNFAYLANRDAGLQIIDVSNPAAPVVVGAAGVAPSGSAPLISVAVAGNTAYVGQNGVRTYDITNPASPALIGGVGLNDLADALALDGNRLLLANNTEGLGTISITNSTWATPLGSVALSGGGAAALDGQRLYVGGFYAQTGGGGVLVFDLADPVAPTFVGQVATSGQPVGAVASSGDLVYATSHLFGLEVIDSSNPALPVVLGTANLANASELRAAVVEGTHVYVAAGAAGLHIVDVSTPSAPAGVGTFDTPGSAAAVVVIGNHAFVADGSELVVIDVSNPASPSQVASVLSSGAVDVARLGSQTLAVLDWNGLVHEVDVSNPLAPVAFDLVGTYGYPDRISVADGIAYADGGGGVLQVVDVASPITPFGAAGPVGGFGAGEIVVGPDHVYVLTSAAIQVFAKHCSEPSDARVTGSSATLRAWPNPGRNQIAFSMDLPRGGDVIVEVFDVAGRRVREVLRGRAPAGRSATLWDGRDDAGRPLPSSVYFVRLSGAGVSKQRVTLLR